MTSFFSQLDTSPERQREHWTAWQGQEVDLSPVNILPVNILIVDDHPDNLRTLSSILSNQGYRVRKATNGEMALLTIQVEPPDLVLMDIRMPGMDGYTACTLLKAAEATREIPVIFLSASDEVEDKVRAFKVGGADYITKPFRAEEVLIRIQHQLTIQKQRQQLCEHNRRLQLEIHERQQAEAETQLLLSVIQAVRQASNFEQALQAVLCEVKCAIAWDYGEVWTLDETGKQLRLSQADGRTDAAELQGFQAASMALTFACGDDVPGHIWATQESVWIEAIAQMEAAQFSRKHLACQAGLSSVFGVPIVIQGHLIAVLLFYCRSRVPRSSKTLQVVNAIALQLGGFMQRKQAEEELTRANRELKRLVNLDGLTGIANRRCFDETLNQEWRRLRRTETPLALILCDVDYFKAYNDRYGHLAGDDCLKQIAATIAQACKRPADLAARYGGEEFAILLPETDLKGAIHLVQCIQTDLALRTIPHDASPIADAVTVSFGIANLVPTLGTTPDQLIAIADHALYGAKAQGRNCYNS